ncbi:MAG: hypothetical protein ACOCRX_07530 [Candidatus Woesearchaeota archaeon]
MIKIIFDFEKDKCLVCGNRGIRHEFDGGSKVESICNECNQFIYRWDEGHYYLKIGGKEFEGERSFSLGMGYQYTHGKEEILKAIKEAKGCKSKHKYFLIKE